MSAGDGLRCGICDKCHWNRAALELCESSHETRPDYEAQGAAARIAGKRIDDAPYPERTWPEIEWRRGWLLEDLRKDAA